MSLLLSCSFCSGGEFISSCQLDLLPGPHDVNSGIAEGLKFRLGFPSRKNMFHVIPGGDEPASRSVWDRSDPSCIAATYQVKVPLVRSSFSDRNHDGIADVLKLSVVWWPSENGELVPIGRRR